MHLESPFLLLQRTPRKQERLSTLTQSPACKGTTALSPIPRHCNFLSFKPFPEVPPALPWADFFPLRKPQPLCKDFISTWDWVLAFVRSFHHSDKTPEMINIMKENFLVARGFRDLFGLSLLGSVTVAQFIEQEGVSEVSVHLTVATKQSESEKCWPSNILVKGTPKDLTYLH